MKLAVIGSRGFNNYDSLKLILDEFEIIEIVSGGAQGADDLAKRYATENNILLVEFHAQWKTYGKSAGFIRNTKIWEYADQGVAFWDGQSLGTKHSFDLAKKLKKDLLVYNYTDNTFTEMENK